MVQMSPFGSPAGVGWQFSAWGFPATCGKPKKQSIQRNGNSCFLIVALSPDWNVSSIQNVRSLSVYSL